MEFNATDEELSELDELVWHAEIAEKMEEKKKKKKKKKGSDKIILTSTTQNRVKMLDPSADYSAQ